MSRVTFRQCPDCTYDFATGEGTRSCAYAECPYLPQELDVFCPWCRFNYLTQEGNSPCDDPMQCDHRFEPLEHVAIFRAWAAGETPTR